MSDGGEVKEAALWSVGWRPPRRRATVIGDGGLATLTDEDDPGAPVVAPVGRVPLRARRRGDPGRAGHRGRRRRSTGGLVDEHIAYVTCDASFRTPFARGYEVLEELPYREKQLQAALRERGIGRLTIKKRGVDVVPEQLRKRLALSGDEEGNRADPGRRPGHRLLVRPF